MAEQPFYHEVTFIFTATEDHSEAIDGDPFRLRLEKFLKGEFGDVVKASVEVDSVDAEPGDPSDL